MSSQSDVWVWSAWTHCGKTPEVVIVEILYVDEITAGANAITECREREGNGHLGKSLRKAVVLIGEREAEE